MRQNRHEGSVEPCLSDQCTKQLLITFALVDNSWGVQLSRLRLLVAIEKPLGSQAIP